MNQEAVVKGCLDFCQSKMLKTHIKSHLPLWYHYTSFQHLGLFKSGSETNHFPDGLTNFKQLQLCCILNWPLAICGLSRPLTELQWFIVSEIVWAWKPSFMTLHSHYKIVMERNKRFFFILWIGFVSEIYTNVVDSTDKLILSKINK